METNKKQVKLLLGILSVLYLLLTIGAYYFADSYIKGKSEQMEHLTLERLNSYFKFDKKYVDIAYNHYRTSYKQIPIPKPREISTWEAKSSANYLANAKGDLDINVMEESAKELNLREQEKWQQEYEDIYSLFELNTTSEKDYGSGWSIRIVEKNPMSGTRPGFIVYYIYPKMFAYKNLYYMSYYTRPSIEDALQEALDYEIKNDRSELAEYYSKGSTKGLAETICLDSSNDYWYVSKDSVRTLWWNDPNDVNYFSSLYENEKPIPSGSMFNNYYKVFFERSQPTTYSIYRVSQENIDTKMLTMRITLWAILAIAFAIPVVCLSLKLRNMQR